MGLHPGLRALPGGLIGGLDHLGLAGVGQEPNAPYGDHPGLAFMAFQLMFAVITPALITGAFAERKRFKAFVFFSLLWATLVYDPLAHWVWGVGGCGRWAPWTSPAGTVVHISAGVAAWSRRWCWGASGFGKEPMEPHNVPYVVLGPGCCGSAGSASTPAAPWGPTGWPRGALVNTHPGRWRPLTWTTVSWARAGRPSVVGAPAGRWRGWWR